MGKYVTTKTLAAAVIGALVALALDKRGYVPAAVKF